MRAFLSRFSSLRSFGRRQPPKTTFGRARRQRGAETRLVLEGLETRCLLSATLVKDLNTAVGSSILLPEFTDVNGTAFFLADDGVHGRELWKSDGTKAGTHLVKDINRLGGDAFNQFPADLTNVNGTLFFPANDGIHGYQLWKSDGTAAGTVPLTDLDLSGVGISATPYYLTNVGGTLFFAVNGGPTDVQGLWKSDGTVAGTVRVSGDPTSIGPIADVNGTAFFFSYNSQTQDKELWKSDGTQAGTVPLKELNQYDGVVDMVNVNGTLFFNAGDAQGNEGLWKSDGTPGGTVPVDPTGLRNSYPENLTNVNGTLFFEAEDPVHGRQLWESDGTDAGTSIVSLINPHGNAFRFQGGASFMNLNGTLYVTAFDGTNNGLWRSDGTDSGTVLVRAFSSLRELVNANGTLYFNATDAVQGTGLWTSDGTTGGTSLVANLNEQFGFLEPASVGSRLFFRALDDDGSVQPWTSDGTTAGTMMLKDIFPGNQSANIQNPTELNGLLYFVNLAGDSGNTGLLATDGSADGTVVIRSVNATNLAESGGRLYFNGPGSRPFQRALWESDGTAGGAFMLTNLGVGSGPENLTDVNGTLFFTVTPSGGNPQLWESNGTVGGTFQLTTGLSISNLTAVNGQLFFAMDDGVHGNELWVSDGTPAGTHLILDINPGSAGSEPASLTNVNGTLFFSADDGTDGRELWESDGTPGGTFLAADINPGADGSDPTDLTVSNGLLFFSAYTPATGRELWDYDLTSGNVSVFDINPGPAGSNPSSLTDVNGLLFFTANDGTNGRELWVSDGTTTGTQLVADINPGSRGSDPLDLFAMNGTVYFTANDGSDGRQLWQSDGTPGGTFLVQKISANHKSAFDTIHNPEFATANGQLFFVADDQVHGRELWVYTPDSAPSVSHRKGADRSSLESTVTGLAVPKGTETAPAAAVADTASARGNHSGSPAASLPAPTGASPATDGLGFRLQPLEPLNDPWGIDGWVSDNGLSEEVLIALTR